MNAFRTSVIAAALLLPTSALAQGSQGGSAATPDPKSASSGARANRATGTEQGAQPTEARLIVAPETQVERAVLDVAAMPFDAESIRQVVRARTPEIQECYEKVLADTGARYEGRVVVAFHIDPNGNVGEAKVVAKKSSLKDARVHDCVLAMRRWSFPKPPDNRLYPIEYPFELKVAK